MTNITSSAKKRRARQHITPAVLSLLAGICPALALYLNNVLFMYFYEFS